MTYHDGVEAALKILETELERGQKIAAQARERFLPDAPYITAIGILQDLQSRIRALLDSPPSNFQQRSEP